MTSRLKPPSPTAANYVSQAIGYQHHCSQVSHIITTAANGMLACGLDPEDTREIADAKIDQLEDVAERLVDLYLDLVGVPDATKVPVRGTLVIAHD